MAEKVFERVTTGCARFTGRPAMFGLCLVLAGVGIGSFFSNNDHFLNGANLSISIVTLLLLPILQATQNRDGAALQAKLDELIASNQHARNAMIGIERASEETIEKERLDREA